MKIDNEALKIEKEEFKVKTSDNLCELRNMKVK
jgi:hypothetical protein